ncbi:hypothetical protein GCM10020001_049590 [Nonomuraea salmonea]
MPAPPTAGKATAAASTPGGRARDEESQDTEDGVGTTFALGLHAYKSTSKDRPNR